MPLEGANGLPLRCAAADHDVPCLAYALELPRAPRFDVERARKLGIPVQLWGRLQRGETITTGGRTITPERVQGAARRGPRVVYITDTRATPRLTGLVRAEGEGTDLLIAEGMNGDEDERPVRWESPHMTFAESAALARESGVRRLWLTHYSPGLSDPTAYLDRATAIFPAARLGQDGLTATLSFEGE